MSSAVSSCLASMRMRCLPMRTQPRYNEHSSYRGSRVDRSGINRMAHNPDQAKQTVDELEIRALIERWSKAVRDQDRTGIRKDHDADILMFDVPPPFRSRGIEEYMATWETFFSSSEKPIMFNFTDIEVTAGREVAFATAVGHCVNIDKAGQR